MPKKKSFGPMRLLRTARHTKVAYARRHELRDPATRERAATDIALTVGEEPIKRAAQLIATVGAGRLVGGVAAAGVGGATTAAAAPLVAGVFGAYVAGKAIDAAKHRYTGEEHSVLADARSARDRGKRIVRSAREAASDTRDRLGRADG